MEIYKAPHEMTVIGVSWMKGDMGYTTAFPAIFLSAGDVLQLTLDPAPGEGGYKIITAKGLEFYGTLYFASDPHPPAPRDVDRYDYLLEEK